MGNIIHEQTWKHYVFYCLFGGCSILLMWYYLSNTLLHFTTSQQFPTNSFARFPLTVIIFSAEIFSFLFAIYFVYTLFSDRKRQAPAWPISNKKNIEVAILLPVYNEPKDIVERTINACKKIAFEGKINIYILDDSTNDEDKNNMQILAKQYGCTIVRRKDRIGYKAGNINNAIKNAIHEPFFAIFDADQAPLSDFLAETIDYFSQETVAFVQTPQFFIGETTPLERAAKIGTNIFYQAQCVSKAVDGAMPFCGTNAVIRTSAFKQVNGLAYYTATEDIELGMRMHHQGYKGIYVPQVLVHGYAPPDFAAYSSQQYRWANGNLAILRESWKLLLCGNFNMRQQIHMFFTTGWWLVGVATLAYIIVPLLALTFNTGTHHTWIPTALLVVIYFNIIMGISMIFVALHNRVENEKITISDALIQYSLVTNSAFIYTRAAINTLFGRYIGFVTTNKKRSAAGIGLIKWNLLLGAVCFASSIYALYNAMIASDFLQVRTYLPISIWLLFYSIILCSSILFVNDQPSEKAKQSAHFMQNMQKHHNTTQKNNSMQKILYKKNQKVYAYQKSNNTSQNNNSNYLPTINAIHAKRQL